MNDDHGTFIHFTVHVVTKLLVFILQSLFFDEAPQEMLPYKAAAHPWPHGTFWVPPLRVRQETEELLELYRVMISYDEGFVEPLMIIVPSICHAQSMNHKSYFLYSRYFK